MQHQDQYFVNNPTFVQALNIAAIGLAGIGLLRLGAGEFRGFAAEMCYSSCALFFSRTFAQGNPDKVRDFMFLGLSLVAGLLIDTESFFPSTAFQS